MNEELRRRWSDLIRPLFRYDAEFSINALSGDFRVSVSWNLGTDPSRPKKRSKTITILVPREAIDDYQNKSEEKRKRDDVKLRQFIENNLKYLDPHHNHPREQPPPEVQWIAGSNILNA